MFTGSLTSIAKPDYISVRKQPFFRFHPTQVVREIPIHSNVFAHPNMQFHQRRSGLRTCDEIPILEVGRCDSRQVEWCHIDVFLSRAAVVDHDSVVWCQPSAFL
jgi:hypothetical protein